MRRDLAPLERGEISERVIRRGLRAVRQVQVVEPRTERGDRMFLCSVERACAQVDDLDALELLP